MPPSGDRDNTRSRPLAKVTSPKPPSHAGLRQRWRRRAAGSWAAVIAATASATSCDTLWTPLSRQSAHHRCRLTTHRMCVIAGLRQRRLPRRPIALPKHGDPSLSYSSRNLTRGRTLTMATKLERLPQVEVVKPPAPGTDAQTGYDLIFPIGAGSREKWMNEINTIFLTGVPRALRRYPWVYLKQGHNIFWSAPIEEILSDSERISWITGADHGSGPSLIVDLYRGEQIDIDAAALPPPTISHGTTNRDSSTSPQAVRSTSRSDPNRPQGLRAADPRSRLLLNAPWAGIYLWTETPAASGSSTASPTRCWRSTSAFPTSASSSSTTAPTGTRARSSTTHGKPPASSTPDYASSGSGTTSPRSTSGKQSPSQVTRAPPMTWPATSSTRSKALKSAPERGSTAGRNTHPARNPRPRTHVRHRYQNRS